MARRDEPEARTLETSADAKALAADVKARAARIRVVPGLLDGALDGLRGDLERVMREYDKITFRRMGPFQRDLESIAKKAEDLDTAGRLHPRHKRLILQALQHARRQHFWNAHRALAKVEKILGPTYAWKADVEAYRAFHRRAVARVRTAEEELEKLRSVPKPPASPEDVDLLRSVTEACNRVADEAWVAITHRPCADALQDLVAHPDMEGLGLLGVQEFAALRELSDVLEAEPPLRDAIGTQPLADLVVTSEYSSAKWDRVYPQAMHVRRKLQDLFHQVRPVVGGKYGTAFTIDAPVAILERRLAAWRLFPGAEGRAAWADLAELRASGRIPAIQESARIYERYGDIARRAWKGSLKEEVEAQEKELAAAKKAVSGLPSPDSLAP